MLMCSSSLLAGIIPTVIGASLLRTVWKWLFHLRTRSSTRWSYIHPGPWLEQCCSWTRQWLSSFVVLYNTDMFWPCSSLSRISKFVYKYFLINSNPHLRSRFKYLVWSCPFKRCDLAASFPLVAFLSLIAVRVSGEIQSSLSFLLYPSNTPSLTFIDLHAPSYAFIYLHTFSYSIQVDFELY